MRIESRQNPMLKHLARLGREKKYRYTCGEFVCEGEKMLQEALTSQAALRSVLLREGAPDAVQELCMQAEAQGATVASAAESAFASVSNVETPQSVIFSSAMPQQTTQMPSVSRVLLLDGVQDPGNLGTILRTAEAFALDAVVLCEGCADVFSPKVVRSTMGAVFRLPCPQMPLADAVAQLQQQGLAVWASALHRDSVPIAQADLSRAAVIIGSEGRGVTEQAITLAGQTLVIPMQGRAESLNAGVAAAIVIYEMTK